MIDHPSERDEIAINNDCTIRNNEKEKNQPQTLLTQKVESDPFYNQYTIYPLHNQSRNVSDTTLFQMLKVYASALESRTKDLDLMCFPDLYPTGKYGQDAKRNPRLRECDFIKSKLTSKHSRFRLNKQYLFYLLFNHNCRQINAGIFHKLKIVNPKYKWTAADLLQKVKEDKLESNINSIFSRLRGTQAYWAQPRNELNCMIREYGTGTWFITLSPGEWMWSELGEYIRKVNNWNGRTNEELVAADPVSAARFIENRFQAVLKYILSIVNPIGAVDHYYVVREYQGRGLPHFHCLFWIKNAPIYKKSSNEDVKNFILKYVTCRIPDKRISPELHRRVLAYQQHKETLIV